MFFFNLLLFILILTSPICRPLWGFLASFLVPTSLCRTDQPSRLRYRRQSSIFLLLCSHWVIISQTSFSKLSALTSFSLAQPSWSGSCCQWPTSHGAEQPGHLPVTPLPLWAPWTPRPSAVQARYNPPQLFPSDTSTHTRHSLRFRLPMWCNQSLSHPRSFTSCSLWNLLTC